MKKKIFACALSLFLLVGCSSIPGIKPSPTAENQQRIQMIVNADVEVYGVGIVSIKDSGPAIAQSRALKEAKDDLKKKVSKESDAIYGYFLSMMDPYTRKMVTPVIPDLKDFSSDRVLAKASQRDVWESDGNIYVLIAADRYHVNQEAASTFLNFTEDLINKFNSIKHQVSRENNISVK